MFNKDCPINGLLHLEVYTVLKNHFKQGSGILRLMNEKMHAGRHVNDSKGLKAAKETAEKCTVMFSY